MLRLRMMTSSNGNIFRVTGPLCGEFTGPRWIPRTKASAALWCYNGEAGNLRRYLTHYDVTVMVCAAKITHSRLNLLNLSEYFTKNWESKKDIKTIFSAQKSYRVLYEYFMGDACLNYVIYIEETSLYLYMNYALVSSPQFMKISMSTKKPLTFAQLTLLCKYVNICI